MKKSVSEGNVLCCLYVPPILLLHFISENSKTMGIELVETSASIKHSRMIAFIAVTFGFVALLLACIGVGTPNWEVYYYGTSYIQTDQQATKKGSANFFYACSFASNGSLENCYQRSDNLSNYQVVSTDMNSRLQRAAGLSIVGIVFILFGSLATLVIALRKLPMWVNLLAPALFFVAGLFMLASLAEGARVLHYNGYSANLYETAHLLVIFALLLSGLASGRIHFWRSFPNTAAVPATDKQVKD